MWNQRRGAVHTVVQAVRLQKRTVCHGTGVPYSGPPGGSSLFATASVPSLISVTGDWLAFMGGNLDYSRLPNWMPPAHHTISPSELLIYGGWRIAG